MQLQCLDTHNTKTRKESKINHSPDNPISTVVLEVSKNYDQSVWQSSFMVPHLYGAFPCPNSTFPRHHSQISSNFPSHSWWASLSLTDMGEWTLLKKMSCDTRTIGRRENQPKSTSSHCCASTSSLAYSSKTWGKREFPTSSPLFPTTCPPFVMQIISQECSLSLSNFFQRSRS